MPTVYKLHSTAPADIVIDDLPVTATVPAGGNATVDAGNTAADVLGSFKLRDFVIHGQLELIVNGRSVNYAGILRSQASL